MFQQLLQPQVRSPPAVQKQLKFKRDTQKLFLDKSSKPLKPLARGQMIRLHTNKSYARLGHIHGPAKEPRSYMVEWTESSTDVTVKELRPATPYPDASRFVHPPSRS